MARRKRKHVSFFPQKGRLWTKGGLGRRVIILLIALALFLSLGGLFAYYRVLSYLQGDECRTQLEESLNNIAQAEEVQFKGNLQLDGGKVHVPGLKLQRKDALAQLSIEGVNMNIRRRALWNKCLHLEDLQFKNAQLKLNLKRIDGVLPQRNKNKREGLLGHILPDTQKLEAFRCDSFTAQVELSDGGLIELNKAKIKATPLDANNIKNWDIEIKDAFIKTPLDYLQEGHLRSGRLRVTQQNVSLNESTILLSPGELAIKGNYNLESGRWTSTMRANKANVARILNEDWKKRLSGNLFGHLNITGKQAQIEKALGELSLRKGELEALPILSKIRIADTYPYRSLSLNKAKCRITYPYSNPELNIDKAWLFDQIEIEAGQLLQVRGEVIIGNDRSLSGTIKLGLPTQVVAHLALPDTGVLDRIFNATGDAGFMWLTINLSGTIDAPQEDLSVRLSSLIGDGITGSVIKLTDGATQFIGGALGGLLPGKASPEESEESTQSNPPTQDETSDSDNKGSLMDGVIDTATDAAGEVINKGLNIFL